MTMRMTFPSLEGPLRLLRLVSLLVSRLTSHMRQTMRPGLRSLNISSGITDAYVPSLPVVSKLVTRVMTRKDVRKGESWLTFKSVFVRSVAVMYMMTAEHAALASHRRTGKLMTHQFQENTTRQRYICIV